MLDEYATVTPLPFGISKVVAAVFPAQSTVPLEKLRVIVLLVLFLNTQNSPACSGRGYDSLLPGKTMVVVA
jgi:hypothetical protein